MRNRYGAGTAGGKRTGLSPKRSEEHTSELQSRLHLVCRLLLEKKKKHGTLITTSPFTSPPFTHPSPVYCSCVSRTLRWIVCNCTSMTPCPTALALAVTVSTWT